MRSVGDNSLKKITVPFGLLQYAVRHGDFNEIQVLITAKAMFRDGFHKEAIHLLSYACKMHLKTIRKHLHNLHARNWLGFDQVSGRYINRSWLYLRKAVADQSSVGYTIPTNLLQQFRAFAIATTYDQLIAGQQYRLWLEKTRERTQKGTSQQIGLQYTGFYPVANKAYSKIYNVSEATASRHRKLASDAGYIELQEHLEPIYMSVVASSHRELFRRYSGDPLIFKEGKYFIQGVTHVRSKMIRKRISSLMENNESIKKGK